MASSPLKGALAGLVLGSLLLADVGCDAGSPARTAATYADESALVFRDVAVFPGLSNSRTPHQDVWVEGSVISRVTPAGELATAEGVLEIDGAGKTLLPGFIDVHVHCGSSTAPPWLAVLPDIPLNVSKFLYAGVTTVFDVGGELGALQSLKASLNSGEVVGPDLYFSGPHIAKEGGHPQAMVEMFVPWPVSRVLRKHLTFAVEDEGDVDQAIGQIKEAGGDLVKVTIDEIPLGKPYLEPALLKHTVERAHAEGFRVVAHIGDSSNVEMALDAGVDGLVHSVYRDRLSPELAGRLAEAGVPVAPTLAVWNTLDYATHEGWQEGPFQAELTDPAIIEAMKSPPDDWGIEGIQSWLDALHAHRQARVENVALLGAKGVTVMVGSDSPTIGHEAGVAYHTELELLVEAGFPPGDVLRRATAVNAAAMGLKDRGTIEAGKRADLVLVEGDPTAAIGAAHDIVEVVRAGRRVQRRLPYEDIE